jgi:hypothetical protein
LGEVLRVKITDLATPLPVASEIAIFLGDVDITSQMQREGDEFVYKSDLLPLAIGEQTLTIYRTTIPEKWESIATFLVKIDLNLSPSSTTNPTIASPIVSTDTQINFINFNPKFTVNLKSQVESRSADAGKPADSTSLQASFNGELSAKYQIGTGILQGKANFVGSPVRSEALRFNELKERASLVDLSSYSIDFTSGDMKFALGNVCFGDGKLMLVLLAVHLLMLVQTILN